MLGEQLPALCSKGRGITAWSRGNRLVVHTVSALCICYRHLLITMDFQEVKTAISMDFQEIFTCAILMYGHESYRNIFMDQVKFAFMLADSKHRTNLLNDHLEQVISK